MEVRPTQPKPERPFLEQISIPTKVEGKGPHFKNVRVYPNKNPKDPRPLVYEDLDGNEEMPEPIVQLRVEKRILGAATLETLKKLEEQEKKMKARSKR